MKIYECVNCGNQSLDEGRCKICNCITVDISVSVDNIYQNLKEGQA